MKEKILVFDSTFGYAKYFEKIYKKKYEVITINYSTDLKNLDIFYFDKRISSEYEIAGYLGATVMTLSALLMRYYNYKIIITTKNQDIIKTAIEPEYKDEARELISHIRRNIKPKEPILKAI